MPSSTYYAALLALVLGVGCGKNPDKQKALAPDEQKALEEKLAKAKLEKIVVKMRAALRRKFSKLQDDRMNQGNAQHGLDIQCLEEGGNFRRHNPALSVALLGDCLSSAHTDEKQQTLHCPYLAHKWQFDLCAEANATPLLKPIISVRYNAVRTDSIVTPLIGTVFLSVKRGAYSHEELEISLGWREGAWEFNFAKGTDLVKNHSFKIISIDSRDESGRIWTTIQGELKAVLKAQSS